MTITAMITKRQCALNKAWLLNLLLFLNIWLMAFGLLFSFLYIDSSPSLFTNSLTTRGRTVGLLVDLEKTHRVRNRHFEDHELSEHSEAVKKGFLTKARYPLTLTSPFTIENPAICHGNVTVLIIVHTSPEHFYKRSILRQSIGSVHLFKKSAKYSVRIAFILGQTRNARVAFMLNQENEKFHDIVQGEFQDSYHNLTLKGVLAFRWITHHCKHAKLVVKMDDDIFVNIFEVLEYDVPEYSSQPYQILCNKMFPLRINRRATKWKLDADFFRGYSHFPAFCSGFTVFLTTDSVQALYKAAHFTPFLWVDDVYLFGLLPSKYNITQRKINNRVSLHMRRCELSYNSTQLELVSCTAPIPRYLLFYWNRTLTLLNSPIRDMINETFFTESLEARVERARGNEKWEKYN